MKLVGIGTDIEQVSRFESHAEELPAGPATRYLTAPEMEEAMTRGMRRTEYLSSRFAAKEAVLKSLGCGIYDVSFREVEVRSEPSGKPVIRLFRRAFARAMDLGVDEVLITISHTPDYAVAFAAAVAEDDH